MAGGWTKDSAVQEQIDARIDDAVALARSQLPQGESKRHCEACDERIPDARRQAIPGVRYCVKCQEARDRANIAY